SGTFCNMVLSFTAGSPNQKASFESNNSNPFKRVVILVNHPDRDILSLARGAASCRKRYFVTAIDFRNSAKL
ncbi:MAG: hypothetical protein ABSD90_16260, partial [Methylocystis sp.]